MADFAQAGLNLAGNLINTGVQELLNQKHWRQQTARQDQLLADERAYNDPSAQIDRLERAGINRTFSGMQAAGIDPGNMATGQSQEMAAPPFTNTNVGNGLGSDIFASQRLSNDTLRAKTQYEEALSRMEAQQHLNDLTDSQSAYYRASVDQIASTIKNIDEKTRNLLKEGIILDAQGEIANQQAFQAGIDSLFHYGKRQQEYQERELNLKALGIDVKILQEELAQEMIRTGILPALLRSEVNLNNAQAGEANAHASLMGQIESNQKTEGEILSYDKAVARLNALKANTIRKMMLNDNRIGIAEALEIDYFLTFGDELPSGSYTYKFYNKENREDNRKNAEVVIDGVNAAANAVEASTNVARTAGTLGRTPQYDKRTGRNYYTDRKGRSRYTRGR